MTFAGWCLVVNALFFGAVCGMRERDRKVTPWFWIGLCAFAIGLASVVTE